MNFRDLKRGDVCLYKTDDTAHVSIIDSKDLVKLTLSDIWCDKDDAWDSCFYMKNVDFNGNKCNETTIIQYLFTQENALDRLKREFPEIVL